jgi:DNA-directed RNA polymerase subunit RPC12/RpoP
MADKETSIIHCKRCGVRTRHERQQWKKHPLLIYWATGRVKVIDGWECTRCGHRTAIHTRFLPEEQAD